MPAAAPAKRANSKTTKKRVNKNLFFFLFGILCYTLLVPILFFRWCCITFGVEKEKKNRGMKIKSKEATVENKFTMIN
jgi:hypothetical protein